MTETAHDFPALDFRSRRALMAFDIDPRPLQVSHLILDASFAIGQPSARFASQQALLEVLRWITKGNLSEALAWLYDAQMAQRHSDGEILRIEFLPDCLLWPRNRRRIGRHDDEALRAWIDQTSNPWRSLLAFSSQGTGQILMLPEEPTLNNARGEVSRENALTGSHDGNLDPRIAAVSSRMMPRLAEVPTAGTVETVQAVPTAGTPRARNPDPEPVSERVRVLKPGLETRNGLLSRLAEKVPNWDQTQVQAIWTNRVNEHPDCVASVLDSLATCRLRILGSIHVWMTGGYCKQVAKRYPDCPCEGCQVRAQARIAHASREPAESK